MKFTFYFFLAAALWTPLFVGVSMILGRRILDFTFLAQQSFLLRIGVSAVLVFISIRLLIRLASFRGRQQLVARWRRLTNWEFWPPWVFYPPVVLYVVYLGLKYRSLTLFTCANPTIEAGGFVGESKSSILQALGVDPDSRGFIAPYKLLPGALSQKERFESANEFMRQQPAGFPIVLKPDVGQRGSGVEIVRSEKQMEAYLRASTDIDVIIQQYVPGDEFGLFYYRYPNRAQGSIFSITKKLFPTVVGDGESSLERLILKDDRAVCLAHVYFDVQQDRLWQVLGKGEQMQLVEIGTHCRGSIFLDGMEIKTDAME